MIYFVGAGSGAADLITVRGMKLLQEAEVMVYAGSLVNPELLAYAPPGCEIYDSARLHLQQVMDIMIPAARAGKNVVRLHTGDPSIYGAIREQMDRLEEAGIPYEVCPGVSSFCGAAAALKKEYTLPGVSQTLILTRMEGRTPVPEREKIRSLAAHGASMAIFLSASMLPRLTEELLGGGSYTPDTPCVIVYKATWPEEKTVETTLSQLAEAAASEGITKTALILVGDFLGDSYELSKLYDPSFSTEFRQGIFSEGRGKKPEPCDGQGGKLPEIRAGGPAGRGKQKIQGRRVMRTAIVCYTDRGLAAARKIARAMQELPGIFADTGIFRFRREETEAEPVETAFGAGAFFGENTAEASPDAAGTDTGEYCFSDTQKLLGEQFDRREALVFVGAAGIAVRETAPWLRHKAVDPAVLVADEGGQNIIPLLSGHLGGANELAEKLAAGTGGRAVITTASEGRGIPAVDLFAQENGLRILDLKAARRAAAWLLKIPEGKPEYREDGPERGRICAGETEVPVQVLTYVLGVGTRKGISAETLMEFIRSTLKGAGIEEDEVWKLCSLDRKGTEPAIQQAAAELGIPFEVFSPEELECLEGAFIPSEFVASVTGIDNVCERSAAAGCGGGWELVVPKTARDGMTLAVARRILFPGQLAGAVAETWSGRKGGARYE